MKKNFVYLFLIASIFCNAQISDLASLSNGSFMNFSSIYDKKENLTGYMSFFNKGKVDEKSIKLEYVYLDKNLNKVSNGEFITQSSVGYYRMIMNTKGNIELYPELDENNITLFNYGKVVIPDALVLDLNSKTVTKKRSICYEDNKFEDCPEAQTIKEYVKGYRQERKQNGKVYESIVTVLDDGTYLVYEYYEEKGRYKNNAYIKFDANNKEVWRYEYNKDLEKNHFEYINILHFGQDFIYFIKFSEFKKDKSAILFKLDLSTGKKIIEQELISEFRQSALASLYDFKSGYVSINNKKEFEDKLVFVGKNINKNNEEVGTFRMIIDKNTDKVSFSSTLFEDASKFIKVDKQGGVEKGYFLKVRDFYFMKNGSVGILYEKFKIGVDFITKNEIIKTTDLVYFNLDKDYKLTDVKVLSKEKSKNVVSDYLFSQYINEGNDVAFFYRDYLEDSNGKKNWSLYINTIKNGVFNQEQIPISSKENTILPYMAKEGYILLREFNKTEKYNGIRLERLNY